MFRLFPLPSPIIHVFLSASLSTFAICLFVCLYKPSVEDRGEYLPWLLHFLETFFPDSVDQLICCPSASVHEEHRIFLAQDLSPASSIQEEECFPQDIHLW
jgi:hypothetical protein